MTAAFRSRHEARQSLSLCAVSISLVSTKASDPNQTEKLQVDMRFNMPITKAQHPIDVRYGSLFDGAS